MLEEEQYQALRERARRSGKSMGCVIREVLDASLCYGAQSAKAQTDELGELNGFFSDTEVTGRKHDDILYGGQ